VGHTGKPSQPKGQTADSMPFEAALKTLESIVEAMEEGELPLEVLMEKYGEGTKLVRNCQAKLEEAELVIKQLEKTASGEAVPKSLNSKALNEDE
jgi:exodeoxyribonuclease VII small subunit